MKLVSVIVPVHNAAGTLEAAARSALSQSYSNIELILVDDGIPAGVMEKAAGSSEGFGKVLRGGDGSGDLCEEIARQDERVRVFHMEDRGVSAARNLGLDNAQGEYITFLDADDVLHPELVRTLLDLLEETGADYAGCGFERREGDAAPFAGTPITGSNTTGPVRGGEPASAAGGAPGSGFIPTPAEERAAAVTRLSGAQIITRGILSPEKPDTRVWSKLFCRSYIGQKRFREGLTIGEDFLFLAGLAGEQTQYVSIPSPLYSYYLNPRGAMERPFVPGHMDQLRCWELAGEEIRSTFPDLLTEPDNAARFAAQNLIAATLTASKIARLPAAAQAAYETEFGICRARIREYAGVRGAGQYLPRGYAVKIRMLLHAPGLYRKLYR